MMHSTHPKRRHFIARMAALAAAGPWLQAHAQKTAQPAPAPSAPANAEHKVLIVGDSLSAEYGLARGTGWVALLEQRIRQNQLHAQVINASVSGETTAGGRARMAALLKQHQPSIVVVELGGNDALRGLPMKSTADNLRSMLQAAQNSGAQTVLLGMQMPPNYGAAYAREFAQTFTTVAQNTLTALLPFFLEGVADGPNPTALFQADRIHPNAQAQPRMLDNVWPLLEPLLRKKP